MADWATRLYTPPPAGPEVRDLAESIRNRFPAGPERIAAAIEHVQDEIRYFAVALGAGGYVPMTPEETLRAGEGDCKAKTLLLITLLNELGVDSQAALVSLSSGFFLDEAAPSPLSFDHVVVRLEHNGNQFWVDPTALLQRGVLYERHQPDYGYALLATYGEDTLLRMPQAGAGPLLVDVFESYDVRMQPIDPGRLDAEFVFRGASADELRLSMDAFGRGFIEEWVEQTYTRYEGFEIVSLDIRDDMAANIVTVTLDATVPEFFTPPADGERRAERTLRPWSINRQLITALGDAEGRSLLAYPTHTRHEIELLLPGPAWMWSFEAEHTHVENALFRFSRWIEHDHDLLRLIWRQSTFAPIGSLEGEDSSDGEAMRNALSYSVWLDESE